MAKAVNQAWQAVSWESKTYVELIGVVGGQESRYVTTAPFGESRSDVTPALEDIGERYEWTLTPENYKRVIAELDTLKRRFEESRPVKDNRRTPEEESARVAEQKAREQDQAIEGRLFADNVQKTVAELKAKYPWAKQDGSDHARASANIKRELAEAFPGHKFRVRSDSFSGGDSVDIGWENGPTTKEVEAITNKYQSGSFDGMQDLYEYDHSAFAEAVDKWLGSAKYVQEQRKYTAEVIFATARLLCEAQHVEYKAPEHTWELRNVYHVYGSGDDQDLLTHIYRIVEHVSFPPAFEVVGLKRDDENGHHSPYTLELKTPEKPTPVQTTSSTKGEIQKHHHTKHGFDFWLVVLADRVDTDQFAALRQRCEAAGGWYSRKWGKCPGGFAFKEESKAQAFLASL
jgi:hypothetical protein